MLYKSPVLNQFQWSVEISLQDDFNDKIYRDLLRAGYNDADRQHAIFQYFNILSRQIERKLRQVLYSKEFTCPTGYEAALKEFEGRVERGANLIPFLSQKVKLCNYNDLLLNDWGIQHFHLSRRYREDGFVQRSQYQVFTYVTQDTMYMIQADPHDADDLYNMQEMVRILRDNWPELMRKSHMQGVTGLTEKMDDHAYGIIRNAHITTFTELGENEVYAMIGGGYAANGFSLEALRSADFWMNRLESFQLVVKENVEWVGKTVIRMCGKSEQHCDMKIKLLWIDNVSKVTMCEEYSGLIIQMNIKENRLWICEAHEVFESELSHTNYWVRY